MVTTINGTMRNDLIAYSWPGPVPKGYHVIPLDRSADIIKPMGGNDIIILNDADDIINFGKYLTNKDFVDGGSGYDTVSLSGDYSGGLILTRHVVMNISEFRLSGGHNYNLTFTDDAVTYTAASDGRFHIDASELKSDNSLTLDASRERDVAYYVSGGAGNDTISTGSEDDWIYTGKGHNTVYAGAGDDQINDGSGLNTLYGGPGFNTYYLSGIHDVCYGGNGEDLFMPSRLSVNEHFDGGGGNFDRLMVGQLTSPAHFVFNAQTMVNVEYLDVNSDQSVYLKLDDANVAAGRTLTVSLAVGTGPLATFDGSAETDGRFVVYAGTFANVTGGAGNDVFHGDLAKVKVDGGGGFNTMNVYDPQTDTGFETGAIANPASLKNVQKLILDYSGTEFHLTIDDAIVPAGHVLQIDGTQVSNGLQFDGSAETDGSFSINCPNEFVSNGLVGSSGNDVFSFTEAASDIPAFLASDSVNGGPGRDTVVINSDLSAGVVFTPTTMTNVETLKLTAGHSYNLTTDNATVAAGATLTVIASGLGASDHLTFNGAAETDGHFKIVSGLDGDNLTGGALSDTFVYLNAAQSSGAQYDAIHNINFALDKLDVSGSITAVDTAVHAALSTASFDTDLTAAVSGHLIAGSAMLVSGNAGTLNNQVFLVIDQNGVAGYQSGEDLVIHLAGHSGTLATGDFI